MFLNPLVFTIEELVERWAEHRVNSNQVLELCRQQRLEMVFPADGRRFWAYRDGGEGKAVIVAECVITGYIAMNTAGVGEIIANKPTHETRDCYAPISASRELFNILRWLDPDLDEVQKVTFNYHEPLPPKPNNGKGIRFKPVLNTHVIMEGVDQLVPLSKLTTEDRARYITLFNHGDEGWAKFDFKENGLFTLDQARITYRSIKDCESSSADEHNSTTEANLINETASELKDHLQTEKNKLENEVARLRDENAELKKSSPASKPETISHPCKNSTNDEYAPELALALELWEELYLKEDKPDLPHTTASTNWLNNKNYPLTVNATKRIIALSNPASNKNTGKFKDKS